MVKFATHRVVAMRNDSIVAGQGSLRRKVSDLRLRLEVIAREEYPELTDWELGAVGIANCPSCRGLVVMGPTRDRCIYDCGEKRQA